MTKEVPKRDIRQGKSLIHCCQVSHLQYSRWPINPAEFCSPIAKISDSEVKINDKMKGGLQNGIKHEGSSKDD